MAGVWGNGEGSFHADRLSYIHQKDGGDQAFRAMLEDVDAMKTKFEELRY